MSTESQSPPLDPILIPDSPDTPFCVKNEETKEPSKSSVTPIRVVPSLSPEEVALMAEMYAKEALRCAAILLYWASQGGSEEVSGVLVLGITEALHLCADRLKGERE